MRVKAIISGILLLISAVVFAQEEITEEELASEEIQAILPFIDSVLTINVSVDGDHYIFDGDILVNSASSSGRGGATIITGNNDRYKWPNSTIPYTIAVNHPKRADIEWAINHLNSNTNLCLRPNRPSDADYIEYVYEAGRCGLSWIGKQGGRQEIKIGDQCGNTRGSAVHETMHAAGFYHEQSRADRNTFVQILTSNVDTRRWPNALRNFLQYTRGRDVGPYDYGSIMHYGATSFAKRDPADRTRSLTTIRVLQSGHAIGQRNQLSAGDISCINLVYTTPGSCSHAARSTSGTGSGSGSGSSGSSYFTDVDELGELLELWGWDDESGSSVDIQYELELVPQQTGFSCWAAGAAMIVGWRDQVCINPAEIASGTGYWAQYQQGLNANDTTMFRYWGLQYEAPQTYTPQGLIQLVGAYGPLWVATHEGAPHIRVIAGITGDGSADGTVLTIYDPWQRGMRQFRPQNTGSVYNETYTEFERKQRELAERESNEPAPYYVAHN
jgi:hypothetical protein